MWARLQAACRSAGFLLWRRICTQAGSFLWEPFWRLFLATSDEAVLILLGNPQYAPEVGRLLAVKVVIAIAGGYVADLCLKDRLSGKKEEGVLRVNCGCHADHAGILMPAWRHTFRLFLYLFLFTWILDLCVEIFGIQGLSEFLLGDTVFQPVIAAVIGLIPNCAASVILTELYLSGRSPLLLWCPAVYRGGGRADRAL